MAKELKPGDETSEYKQARSSGTWGIVALILGVLTTTGASVAQALGNESTWGIIAGGVIAAAGVAQKTLADLGYINSRTVVKKAAEGGK